MALAIDNTALVVASRGSIFTAAANTALPAGGIMAFAQVMSGLSTTITGWSRVGNTSHRSTAVTTFAVTAPKASISWAEIAELMVPSDANW